MTTAVDTSVLIAITKGETDAHAWVDLLFHRRADGDLLVCDVVAAEFFSALMDVGKFRRTMRDLGITFSPTSLAAAQLAEGDVAMSARCPTIPFRSRDRRASITRADRMADVIRRTSDDGDHCKLDRDQLWRTAVQKRCQHKVEMSASREGSSFAGFSRQRVDRITGRSSAPPSNFLLP